MTNNALQISEGSMEIMNLIKKPAVINRFDGLSSNYLNKDRMIHLANECLRQNPALGECDPKSVLGAFITSASLGLEPNTPLGHAYLIPYKSWTKDNNGNWVQSSASCTFQIGYRGFIQLFHRTHKILDFHASAIRENDHFCHAIGTKTVLEYSKALSNRGNVVGAFCHINKKNGGQDFNVITAEEIEKIKNTSETYKSLVKAVDIAKNKNHQNELKKAERKLAQTPWVMWEDEMCAKSVVKKLAKNTDLDSSIAMAAELDSLSDIGRVDFSQLSEASAQGEIFDAVSSQANNYRNIEQSKNKEMPKFDLDSPDNFKQTNQNHGDK